jgi:hypothetical protein
MKTTTALLPCLGLALGLLAGCSRDEAPAPAAEATYSRTVTYLDATSPIQVDSTFKTPVLKAFVQQNANDFTVFVERPPNREIIAFSFTRAKLPANPVGTYRFKTVLDGTPDVDFAYRIVYDKRRPGSTSWWVYDKSSIPTGSFTITAYDAAHRLVSGRFEVNISDASDPFALSNTYPNRRCSMSFEGTFTNAPVQDVQ